jgi:hypothetical protein
MNMDTLWAFGFAFIVGLTVCGLAGTIMEIASGTRLRMAEPFVSGRRPGRSLLASMAAGPFMLFNDAVAARREGRIGAGGMTATMATASVWVLSMGILTTELALLVVRG